MDVTTGLVTHGRPGRAGAEVAAGLFLNTDPDPTRRQTARPGSTPSNASPNSSARAHRYRRYPLQAMQSDAGRQLFNTVFNYVNYHPFAALAGTTGIELLDFDVHEQTNFALLATAGIDPRTQRLFLRVNGDPQSVTAAQSTRIRKHIHACAGGNRTLTRAGHRLCTDELTARDATQLISEQAGFNPTQLHWLATPRHVRRVPRPRRSWSTCSPRCSAWTPLVYTTISSPSAETPFLPSSCAVRLRSVASLSISRTCSPGPRSPNWPSRVHGRRRSRKALPSPSHCFR